MRTCMYLKPRPSQSKCNILSTTILSTLENHALANLLLVCPHFKFTQVFVENISTSRAVILDLALSPSHTNLLLSHGYYCKIFTSEILNHVTQVAKNGMYAKEINFTFLKAVELIFLVCLSSQKAPHFWPPEYWKGGVRIRSSIPLSHHPEDITLGFRISLGNQIIHSRFQCSKQSEK